MRSTPSNRITQFKMRSDTFFLDSFATLFLRARSVFLRLILAGNENFYFFFYNNSKIVLLQCMLCIFHSTALKLRIFFEILCS